MFRGLLLLVLGSVTWVNKILRLPQLPRMFVPSFAYGAWLATPSRCARPWWWWWWLGNSLWLEDLDDLIEAVNMVWNYVLAGGNSKICLFSPLSLGKWSHLTHTFQRGWNHQPVIKYGGGGYILQIILRGGLQVHPPFMNDNLKNYTKSPLTPNNQDVFMVIPNHFPR